MSKKSRFMQKYPKTCSRAAVVMGVRAPPYRVHQEQMWRLPCWDPLTGGILPRRRPEEAEEGVLRREVCGCGS
jgi:hypothetical protein